MIKSIVLALAATAATLGATSAHAGVSWSIGINVPLVGAVVSNAPVYYDGPGYGSVYAQEPAYAPEPVYVPAPVYRAVPRVDYYPAPVYYRPVPVAYPRYYPQYSPQYSPRYYRGPRHDRDHWGDHRDDDHRGRDDRD